MNQNSETIKSNKQKSLAHINKTMCTGYSITLFGFDTRICSRVSHRPVLLKVLSNIVVVSRFI